MVSYQNATTVNNYVFGISMGIDSLWLVVVFGYYLGVYVHLKSPGDYKLEVKYEEPIKSAWFRMTHSNGYYIATVILFYLMFFVSVMLFFSYNTGDAANIAQFSSTISVFIVVPAITIFIVERDAVWNLVAQPTHSHRHDAMKESPKELPNAKREEKLVAERTARSWLQRQFFLSVW